MTGKQKCRILREIRRQIAEQNDIRFVVEECTHRGKCRGTCPKCEWEVRLLERELEKRRRTGKAIALAGISAGFLLTSCTPVETVKELFLNTAEPLEGDIPAQTEEGAIAASDIPGETAETAPETEEETEEMYVTAGEPAVEWEDPVEEGMIPAETEEETEEETALAGVPVWEEEIIALEGDPVFVEPEDGGGR